MTKGMLKPSRSGGPNQGYIMGTYGKRRYSIVQDTPKQDYILCTRCEARFEKVETYTARKFFTRFRNQAFCAEFPIEDRSHIKPAEADIMRLINVSRGMMRLLVYSILWRVSICSLEMYASIKLNPEIEEMLRLELDETLADTEKDTLQVCERYSATEPTFPYVMLASSVKTDESSNMIASFELEQTRAFLVVNEFVLQFFISSQVKSDSVGFNISSPYPEVGLFRPEFWQSFVNRMARMAAEHRVGNMGKDA